MVLVVNEQRLLPYVRDRDDLGRAVFTDAHAALAVGTEARRLAVLQVDAILLGLTHRVEGTVVVDIAVLEDLDEGSAAMCRCPPQHFRNVLAIGVHRARDEARLGADGDAQRVERLIDRAERRRARPLAPRARRRVLALRQPVDLVVEEENRDVHVAPQRVDEVVAADRQRVAVAGDDPHGEVRDASSPARWRSPARGRGSSASRTSPCSTGSGRRSRCPTRRRCARAARRARA